MPPAVISPCIARHAVIGRLDWLPLTVIPARRTAMSLTWAVTFPASGCNLTGWRYHRIVWESFVANETACCSLA